MRGAGLGHVGVGAAELLHGDVLAGDGLDDVGPGDEHLAGLVDHDHEVGQGGGVDVSTGGGAHDQRDLRDDAGGQDVVAEDPAVQAQRDDALLDARAGAVVDADERAAGLDRQFLDLDDLLAVHLAEAAAEHRGVLAEDAHVAAVDGAVAGDHAVAERTVVAEAEVGAAVPGQRVEFDERSRRPTAHRCARGRSACPWRAPSRRRLSPTGCSDSSLRLCSSASLPAVVWMSMVCSAAGSAVWSVTLVMGFDVIGSPRAGV